MIKKFISSKSGEIFPRRQKALVLAGPSLCYAPPLDPRPLDWWCTLVARLATNNTLFYVFPERVKRKPIVFIKKEKG